MAEMITLAGTADYYAERAIEYERIYELPERQRDLSRLREIVKAYGRGKHVLEVACGTGYWTQILAAGAESVVATDIGDAGLEFARAKPLLRGHVVFQRADAFALELVAGDFNAAFAGFWWSHVPREAMRRFLDGLHSRIGVARSVLFVDNRYVERSSTPIYRTDSEGNTYQLRAVGTGKTYEVLKNFPSPDELRSQLASRGATSVEVVELEYYWLVSYEVGRAVQQGDAPDEGAQTHGRPRR